MHLGPGTPIAGKYKLEHLLASGGMGEVWVALHEQLDTRVAIKFMSAELASSAQARARFDREAKAAATLRSPNVVQVLDYGVQQETPYIVLELLEGQDLRSRINQLGRLGLDEAQGILTQICKALRLAAEAGIVHRDLKPSNIYLARVGEEQVVKILDFGVAKAMRVPVGEKTATGTLLGSPHYMSPEQARGGVIDHRSDLFSTAVILFQMVTGTKPFQGSELGDVLVKICSDPLPVATDLNPALPPSIDAFFRKGLARVPAERFQSAAALAYEFAVLVAQHFGLAGPSGDVLLSTSIEGTAASGARQALAPPAEQAAGPTEHDEPTTAALERSAPPPQLRAATPPRSSTREAAEPEREASTLSLATGSRSELSEIRPRRRWTSGWAALGGALVAGALVYALTRPAAGPPVPSASASTTPVGRAAASQLETATASATASTTTEREPPVTPSASVSATASARPSESTSAPPRTTAAPSKPDRRKPDNKHPVLGI